MEQREPGWYTDPWQDGLQRRWDGERWTADVRDPHAPAGATHPEAGGPSEGAEPISRVSAAERASAAHEGREPGDPTFAGLPWGRWNQDPASRRTDRLLVRAIWGIALVFGALLVIWAVMTLF